jgi:hypothetical protein
LRLDFAGFLIAPLRTQRIRQQSARLRLRTAIPAGERQRLAPAALGLM